MKQGGALLIRDGVIVTMDPSFRVIQGDVLVRDGRIADIGRDLYAAEATVIEAGGGIVMPGLIQTHVHLDHGLFRGMGHGLDLGPLLRERLWPLEAAHDEESVRAAVSLSVAELLAGGTTAVCSMDSLSHADAVFETLRDFPMYAIVGPCLMDRGRGIPKSLKRTTKQCLQRATELFLTHDGSARGRLRVAFAPRSPGTTSEELQRGVSLVARSKHAMVHMHAAQSPSEVRSLQRSLRRRPIELLHERELLEPACLLAHASLLSDHEKRLLRVTGTSVAHCPGAGRFASAQVPLQELRQLGVGTSLGCATPAYTHNLDGFQAMRLVAALQNAKRHALEPRQLVSMATLEGARAVGWDNEMGSLEVGKVANLLILDTHRLSHHPVIDPYASIAFSASAADLRLVLVDGVVVKSGPRCDAFSEGAIKTRARRAVDALLSRAAWTGPRPLSPRSLANGPELQPV